MGGIRRAASLYVDTARELVYVRKGRPSWGVSVMAGLLRFDTGVLPDNAVVTSASLRLRLVQKVSVKNPSLVAEWYGAANWPIESSDWTASVGVMRMRGRRWRGWSRTPRTSWACRIWARSA